MEEKNNKIILMEYTTLKDIWFCLKCPWRLLAHSKRSMRFSPFPKHQQTFGLWFLTEYNHWTLFKSYGIIFLVIHEGAWISRWFLFSPLMKLTTVTLKSMSKLLSSIYGPGYWLAAVLSVNSSGDTASICHYHQEVSSCNWVWPSRTGW